MSAKRARKPLAEASANRRKKPKESGATAPAETFTPISHRKPEHTGEPRIPEGTTLSPLPIFSLYWGDEILEEIVTATNLYAKSKQNGIPPELRDLQREWRPLTVSELKRFLGATIFMGVTKAPQRADYWSRAFVNMPKCSLPLRRYEQIKRYLHISMPPPPNAGKPKWTDKLEPLSSHLRRRSRELYLPSTHVATDEMMVRFKGRSAHTVRMPSKPISLDAARSNADRRHPLVAMVKKRRCIVCRFEFKKTKCGRQAPKLAKYECTGCQPAAALCAPEGGECWDKWHSGGAEGSA